MEKEYRELDRRLFDKRRRDGTACVVLHGQPGGGKSHLARQYVNKNKGKFGGGIFWINCESKEEIYHAFWNIKQKVVARDAPDLCDGVNGNDFVQLVKTWFETRQEWLIIFDGVVVDRDEDATELVNFIPDSKNSSIIYVSRQKNLESKQRLLRPFPLKVGPLKEPEAVKLLFKELHIRKPTDAEKKKASELVKKTGGLPLAIDAISHRLADTHEPLTKYKLSTSADPTLETTYNQIFDDLLRLNHTEAWNLINILCWFAGNIPVEMVHLGLKILRAEKVDVKSGEDGGEPDINTTFGILMRYALIERNEPASDKDSMSSSRDSLSEPEPIDMLKLHGVVQSFCCDSLNARGLLPQWLGYAVNLFSYSYHQADIKIKQKPEPGRVSDYRYYLVHGQRLWDHSVNYENKKQPLDHVRGALHPVIDMINAEIRRREPGSSQESLRHGIFQVSIFDRTSSSSDSNELPGPPTPNHRPTPPRLDSETIFGFPLDKEPTDSPRSFGTASPGIRPKILDHSPTHRPLDFDDAGYESDRENPLRSQPMQQSLSELTERPPNRPRAPTTESNVGEWQIVPSSRKPRKPRKRRDLGSFRPTTVSAQLNEENAVSPQSSDGKDHRRDSSPALQALQNVQAKSPTAISNRLAGFFQKTLSGQFTKSTEPQKPTWAGVAAGKVPAPTRPPSGRENSAEMDLVVSPAAAQQLRQRGRSDASSRGRPSNLHSSSPLATEFRPYDNYTGSTTDGPNVSQYVYYNPDPQAGYPPEQFQYTTPYPGSSSGLPQMSGYVEQQQMQQPMLGQYNPYYTLARPPAAGPNPSPFPIIESTTITTRRSASAGYYPPMQQPLPPANRLTTEISSTHPSPPSPHSRASPPYTVIYPPPPPQIPTGYTSQPMSRDTSHQSAHSTAATEPNIDHSRNTDPLPQAPSYTPPPPSQQQYPYPYPYDPPSSASFSHQQQQHQQPRRRTISNPGPGPGPGIHLSDGTIIAFEPLPPTTTTVITTPSSSSPLGDGSEMFSATGAEGRGDRLQFGDAAPISWGEARRRVRERGDGGGDRVLVGDEGREGVGLGVRYD